MTAYLVTTPKNPEYNGKTFGIQFNMGRAIVSKETLNPHLGYTVEQVLDGFRKDFGYEVTPIGGEVKYQHEAVITTGEIKMEAPAEKQVVSIQPVTETKSKEKRSRRRKGVEVKESASA